MPVVINGSTGISGVDGSAGTPAFQGSDTNTGIRFGADIVSLVTGGSDRLYIDSSGRLGVGTSSPGDYDAGARTLVLAENTNSGITIRGGTTGQGAIYFADGTTGNEAFRGRIEYSHSSDALNFGTAGTGSRVTLDSSGRVGIGVTDPGSYDGGANNLVIYENGNTGITIASPSTSYGSIYFADGTVGNQLYRGVIEYNHNTDYMAFWTAATEKVRLDSSGRLLVGTSTARSNFFNGSVSAAFQIEGTGSDTRRAAIISSDTGAAGNGAYLLLARQISGAIGGNTAVTNGDSMGAVSFQGSDGTEFVEGARIEAVADAAVSANDLPTRLVFSTTADGASSPTERMRITSGGDTGVYHTGGGIQSASSTGASTTDSLFVGRYSATNPLNGTTSINIRTNGNVYNTNGTYTTLSDERLKENIVDAKSQWTDIKNLRVCNFNFRANTGHETHKQLGLIAQEAEKICPGLVQELTLPGDETTVDAEGNELKAIKTVNMSVLYMKAVKALQEAMERIEQLEAKVAALESA